MKDQKFFSTALKKALKEKDSLRVSVLRLLLTALHNEEIRLLRPLKEEEINSLIQKEVKKRQEAIDLYKRGGRLELAEKEAQEKEILASFLPAPVKEEKIVESIKEAREKVGDNFGQIMGLVMAKWRGKVEGERAASLVKKVLAKGA